MNRSSLNVQPILGEESFIETSKFYQVDQFAHQMATSIFKILTAKFFLNFLVTQFLKGSSKVLPSKIYLATVSAPIIEEIIFRGMLLPSIHWVQKGYNRYQKRDQLTEQEKKIQLVFRVQLSALIFAAMHLTNPHKTLRSALVQFSWSYMGGVVYGYLSEKYKTISVSILAHGLNNSFVTASQVYPSHLAPYFLLAILTNRIGFYILGTTNIDEKITAKVYQIGTTCVVLPGRVIQWVTQTTAASTT